MPVDRLTFSPGGGPLGIGGRPPLWCDSPGFAEFDEIWFDDFEFISKPGRHPDVLCLCALEIRSGRKIQLWDEQLGPEPAYRTDARVLHVVFAETAEGVCHLAKGWPLPKNVLDLSPAFRCYINGRKPPEEGKGLLGALSHFGIDTVSSKYKDAMRARILKGRPYSPKEIAEILEYCLSDIIKLPQLLEALLKCLPPYVSLRTLLHWGEFAAVSAAMEHNGIQLDTETADQLFDPGAWAYVRDTLVPLLNRQYSVYVQDKAGEWRFNTERFEEYCKHGPDCALGPTCQRGQACQRPQDCPREEHRAINWPRHKATGKLDLRSKTFDSIAKAYPQIEALRQLRHTQSQMREVKLAIGPDGRNRRRCGHSLLRPRARNPPLRSGSSLLRCGCGS